MGVTIKMMCPMCGCLQAVHTTTLCPVCFHLMTEVSDQVYHQISLDRSLADEYRQRNGKIR